MVQSWGPELIREFLDAYIEGDGSVHATTGHTVAYTASSRMADDLQVLAIKAGYSANVRIDNRVGLRRVLASGQAFHNVHPSYVVSFVRRQTTPLVNHNRQGKAKHDRLVPFAGRVYCVEVPNGLLFVRRNGKVVVSGNTHEIVRHRAGAAYSQESLRYVRLVDVGFRIPPALEPLRRQCIEIVERLEEFQVEAASALRIDATGVPFHVKKEVTSALRRLAPMGLSTDLVMTMNLRTLRHVIEMRTAPGAEEEMRFIFGLLAEVMVAEAPGLFQDFRRLEDGSWVPEYRKV
jgi:hypothetical protein